MTSRDHVWQVRRPVTAVAGSLVTGLFGVVGLVMLSNPPDPADAAIGKGLLTLAAATAIITICLLLNEHDKNEAAKSPLRRRTGA